MPQTLDEILEMLEGDKIELVEGDVTRHVYLLGMVATRSLYGDFEQHYKEADEFQKKVAARFFKGDSEQHYLFVLSSEGTAEAIYNKRFANYDAESKKLEVRPVEEVLLEAMNSREDKKEQGLRSIELPPGYGPDVLRRLVQDIRPYCPCHTILRYDGIGKKQYGGNQNERFK